jgi:hypothetical protein
MDFAESFSGRRKGLVDARRSPDLSKASNKCRRRREHEEA